MIMSLRILVPLDGSAAAEAAIPEAERIAVGEAEIHFLHVVPSLPLALGATSAEMMECHDEALSYLENLRERLPEMRGLDLIRTGEPADAIFQVALEFNIDTIAMCTSARTGLLKWFVGSVAETVIRRAQLPVLLVRPDMPPPHAVLRRILVPLDGSEESLAVLTVVKRLALRTGAEVVLLHVGERALNPLSQRGGPGAPGIPEDPEQKLLAVADRLGESDLIYWQVMAQGDPVEEILHHAMTLDADLIAMSTHARSGRERAIFGSVAQAVLGSAKRTVLLQRPVVHAVASERWRLAK
jgi:nucleotide-binding universal stress UspA family protein